MSQFRFVILRHDTGPGLDRTSQSHFDWMFQVDDRLKTWATATIDNFDGAITLDADQLADHRVAYLEYQGTLSGERGRVTRVRSGQFTVVENREDRFVAQLTWQSKGKSQVGFVICQRITVDSPSCWDEMRSAWSLSFSPGRYETN